MKITQDVRDYAASKDLEENQALEEGMKEKPKNSDDEAIQFISHHK